MRKYLFAIILSFACVTLQAQRIEYNKHVGKSARVLESDLKKVCRLDKSTRDLYMWAGLTSLDVKGSAIYSLKVMYTAAFRITVEKDAPLVLTRKDGVEVVLKSKVAAESKRIDGVETLFATYEFDEAQLIEATRAGIIKVAPTITCFQATSFEKEISMWKLARPLSLRYDMLREYIEKHTE